MSWEIEFYTDESGRQPAREWLLALDTDKRLAAIAAIEVFLGRFGLDICATEHGKQLGQGLFELRVRHEEAIIRGKGAAAGSERRKGREILLRVFCHAYGNRIVLLLGGYDKGASPSPRKQDREIERARKALRDFKARQQGKGTRGRRRP